MTKTPLEQIKAVFGEKANEKCEELLQIKKAIVDSVEPFDIDKRIDPELVAKYNQLCDELLKEITK